MRRDEQSSLDGGTREVEDNQEFDVWCSRIQVQFFFFQGRKSEYLQQVLLKSKVGHRLKLTAVLSNVGVLTRAILVDWEGLKEGARKQRSWKQFFPGVSLQRVEHGAETDERNGVKRKVF